jgi:acetoin utilization protein AcuC
VDIDVHHGDGTQSLFWDDPDVLTISVHETGRTLFPGTGFVEEHGGREAPGTALNVPLEPYSGEPSWVPAVERAVEAMADRFRPTFLVTQHGCDTHAWDPLAHLRVTTAAYARVTRFLDGIAHRYCEGRWLATGGGGYDAFRVVPRSWALVWLAQAHREPPAETPVAWRERWNADAERYSGGAAPIAYIDPPGTAAAEPEGFKARNHQTLERAINQALDLLPAR